MSVCEPTHYISFLTGSSHEGSFKSALMCMHGFGCYKYPDGSNYCGYFKDGLFHGFGVLRLKTPFKFKIKGIYEKGRLMQIVEMIFSDGLCVNAKLKDNFDLDFSEWRYCCCHDRRFLKEIANGLKAAGPTTVLTRRTEAIDLSPGYYDTEGGVFNSSSGFIYTQNQLSESSHFVSCTANAEWIKKSCRVGRSFGQVVEPLRDVCQKIIESNVSSQKWANAYFSDFCSAGEKRGHKYFLKLYNIELEEARKTLQCATKKDDNITSADKESCMSSSSFLVERPKETELLDQICEKSKHVLEDEGSLSINLSMIKMIKAMYGGP